MPQDVKTVDNGPWEGFEVISTYTDEQALEDGFLVDVGDGHRVTRAAYEWIADHLPTDGAPPANWPVELFGWFAAQAKDDRDMRALAACRGLVGSNAIRAQRIWDENIGGGIWQRWPTLDDQKLTGIAATGSDDDPHRLWLVPNGNGMTLMFPSDY